MLAAQSRGASAVLEAGDAPLRVDPDLPFTPALPDLGDGPLAPPADGPLSPPPAD